MRGSERFKALCVKYGVQVTCVQQARSSGHMEIPEVNRLDRKPVMRLGELLELYDDLGPPFQAWLDREKAKSNGEDARVTVENLAFSDWVDFET